MTEEIDLEGITDPKALMVISKLLKIISELEERIARLEKNSGNSSKPPSSDIVKPPHERRQPGVRKIGGQPGHAGTRHKLRALSEVDHLERLVVTTCPECAGSLHETDRMKRQQVYELVEKPVTLTEYRRVGCYCEHCNKVVYAPLPAGVLPNRQYGERFQGLLAYLKGVTGASYSELCDVCTDVFQIPAT